MALCMPRPGRALIVLRILLLNLACLGLAAGGAVAAQPAPVVVSLLEADPARIGDEDGASAVLFVGIVGAALLPSGELAVADGGDHAIHFFDRSGALVRSVGREGAGPGEFRLMSWFGRCADGDLLATDVILGRATVLDPTGQLRETVATPEWFRFNRILACGPGKQLVVLADHPRGRLGEPGKVTRFPAALVRFTLGSDRADTLALVAGTNSTTPGTSRHTAPTHLERPYTQQRMGAGLIWHRTIRSSSACSTLSSG
jgi:hypothetical protein